MTTTSLANVVQTLQSSIIDILKADTSTLTITYADDVTTGATTLSAQKILDGVPIKQIREGGFPLLIVHTPEIETQRLTMTKVRQEMTVHIEVIDRREHNVRILTDAVIEALNNAQSTTKGSGYWWFGRRIRTNLNHTFLPNEEGKAVWHMNMFFTYLWTGN